MDSAAHRVDRGQAMHRLPGLDRAGLREGLSRWVSYQRCRLGPSLTHRPSPVAISLLPPLFFSLS